MIGAARSRCWRRRKGRCWRRWKRQCWRRWKGRGSPRVVPSICQHADTRRDICVQILGATRGDAARADRRRPCPLTGEKAALGLMMCFMLVACRALAAALALCSSRPCLQASSALNTGLYMSERSHVTTKVKRMLQRGMSDEPEVAHGHGTRASLTGPLSREMPIGRRLVWHVRAAHSTRGTCLYSPATSSHWQARSVPAAGSGRGCMTRSRLSEQRHQSTPSAGASPSDRAERAHMDTARFMSVTIP
jgi:hypothetical protein